MQHKPRLNSLVSRFSSVDARLEPHESRWAATTSSHATRGKFWLIGLTAVMSLVLWLNLPSACCVAQSVESGSSSRKNRQQAEGLIPYSELNEPTRRKIAEVVDSPSFYRRLPVNSIFADPEYFRFLVRYPEVIVNIWQLMGVTQMTTERTGPYTIDTDDGVGTVSTLDLVYGNENLHVFYGHGTYEGPVLKRKLNGRCVLILRTDHRQDRAGNDVIINQMDVFLKLDNAGASLMAKTIHPIVGATADQNFSDSLRFVQRLNETTVENGPGVQHMAGRLNIDEETRQKFIEAAGALYAKATNKRVDLDQPRVPSLNSESAQAGDLSHPGIHTSEHAELVNRAGYSQQNTGVHPPGSKIHISDQPIPAYYPTPGYSPPSYQAQPQVR